MASLEVAQVYYTASVSLAIVSVDCFTWLRAEITAVEMGVFAELPARELGSLCSLACLARVSLLEMSIRHN